VCQRERKREREREFNNENNKCKSESEFIEKSYIRARACPRKHTLPVVIHAICVSDFLPFRGQIFFPRVTVNTDHSSLPRASFFHAHFKIKREKSKREREREREIAPEFSLVMGCCFSTEQRHRDGNDTQDQQQRHSQRRNSSSSRQRNARREMDGRFRQHQHRGHRTTMSSEYVFGVKNPFAKFVGKEEDGEEDYPPGGSGGGDDGETREEEELSMERASSANTIGGDDEIETGSDVTVSNGEQVRLLKKERKLSDDREGKKAESLSAAFMRRSFGVGASGSVNHNNNNKNNNEKKKNKHRRTESEPPMNVIGRGNNNSFNSSGKEQPSGGRTSRIARLVSTTADDSYKAFEDDGEDEQQAQIEEQKNNIVRRSATIATSTSTAKARHFRSLSVSAAKFERDGSNNSKEPNDLRASIFEALEKSNNNNNREDVQPQEDRPATPFDDNNCCPTCFEEYQEDNPKITLACAHHFHLACIVEWNERGHSECPTCMTDVGFYMDDDA